VLVRVGEQRAGATVSGLVGKDPDDVRLSKGRARAFGQPGSGQLLDLVDAQDVGARDQPVGFGTGSSECLTPGTQRVGKRPEGGFGALQSPAEGDSDSSRRT